MARCSSTASRAAWIAARAARRTSPRPSSERGLYSASSCSSSSWGRVSEGEVQRSEGTGHLVEDGVLSKAMPLLRLSHRGEKVADGLRRAGQGSLFVDRLRLVQGRKGGFQEPGEGAPLRGTGLFEGPPFARGRPHLLRSPQIEAVHPDRILRPRRRKPRNLTGVRMTHLLPLERSIRRRRACRARGHDRLRARARG